MRRGAAGQRQLGCGRVWLRLQIVITKRESKEREKVREERKRERRRGEREREGRKEG